MGCVFGWVHQHAVGVSPLMAALVLNAARRGLPAIATRRFFPAPVPSSQCDDLFAGPVAVGETTWPPSLPRSWVRLVPEDVRTVWREIGNLSIAEKTSSHVYRCLMLARTSALRLARRTGWRRVDAALFGLSQVSTRTELARSADSLLEEAGFPILRGTRQTDFSATTRSALLRLLHAFGNNCFVRSLAPVDEDLVDIVDAMAPRQPSIIDLVQPPSDAPAGGRGSFDNDAGDAGAEEDGGALGPGDAPTDSTAPAGGRGNGWDGAGGGEGEGSGDGGGGDTAARESSDEKDALEMAADSLEPGDTLEDMETLEKRVNGGMMTLNTDVFPTTEAFLQALRSDPPVCFVHETTPRGVRGINNKGAHPLADMLSQKSGAAPGFGSNFFLSITSLTAIVAAVNHSLRRLLAPRNQGKTAYLVVYVDKDKVAFDPTVVFGDTYTFG